jgi:hypothetical protein
VQERKKMNDLVVDGIVARRNKEPYVRLLIDGQPVAQLDMAQARKIALDILEMAYRTEADAMIHRFFAKQNFPDTAGAALMQEFREYRRGHDEAQAEGSFIDPDTGKTV